MKQCQSCGMPLARDPQGGGTEKDGSRSEIYCSLCYRGGAFVGHDCTVTEMQDIVTRVMKDQGYSWLTRKLGCAQIPRLRRWKGAAQLPKVPPPLLYIAAFAAGLVLDRFVPWTPTWLDGAIPQVIGLLVMATSGVLAASAFLSFRRHRTTVLPWGQPEALMISGPFALTRNPLYLALALLTFGGAVLVDLPWAMVLLPLPLAVMDRLVIPFEEGRLRENFGDDYDAYCRKVRRWV